MVIEPESIRRETTGDGSSARKYGGLLSVFIAEAINRWGINALAEIDVISEAENIALFRRADGYDSIVRKVAKDFNLPYVYCDPVPQIRLDYLSRAAVNEIKNEELRWFDRFLSMEKQSFLFMISQSQFDNLVHLSEKNDVQLSCVTAVFLSKDLTPRIFRLCLY